MRNVTFDAFVMVAVGDSLTTLVIVGLVASNVVGIGPKVWPVEVPPVPVQFAVAFRLVKKFAA
jgi:hypothetical protein